MDLPTGWSSRKAASKEYEVDRRADSTIDSQYNSTGPTDEQISEAKRKVYESNLENYFPDSSSATDKKPLGWGYRQNAVPQGQSVVKPVDESGLSSAPVPSPWGGAGRHQQLAAHTQPQQPSVPAVTTSRTDSTEVFAGSGSVDVKTYRYAVSMLEKEVYRAQEDIMDVGKQMFELENKKRALQHNWKGKVEALEQMKKRLKELQG
mmetsp:Transcript_21944/g.43583  ORF Transcript_21944/g.43583 Transcript_21944/m.43583 type:complete len:206 (-) Transcript_21944:82-699(-)